MIGGGGGGAASSGVGYPGQRDNPVGYTAAPGYTSLTAWPGGTGAKTISDGTNATSGSGTSGDPWVFAFYDFNAGTFGTTTSISNAKFFGCRFQSNNTGNFNVAVVGASNVTFSYCSIVPLASLHTTPPNAAWPSASAFQVTGLQITVNSGSYSSYCIPGNDAYQFGFSIGSGPIKIDHCDIWGFGNAINLPNSTSSQITMSENWIHDPANNNVGGTPNFYHTDGVGYLNGGTPPSNVSLAHCTIAGIGNTNGLAFQAATSPYANISVTGNYFAGFADLVDMCHNVAGSTNLTFSDNVIGTDLPWLNGPLYADFTTTFTHASNATNNWQRNKFNVIPGTPGGINAGFTSADHGKFIWPDTTFHTTDFPG